METYQNNKTTARSLISCSCLIKSAMKIESLLLAFEQDSILQNRLYNDFFGT